MANPHLWSHDTFSNYFKQSPRKAFEFRRDTLWTEIPPEHLTEDEKNGVIPSIPSETELKPQEEGKDEDLGKTGGEIDPPKTETDENSSENKEEGEKTPPSEEKTLTRDDMVKLLKEKGIKFFGGASDDKLAEICKNNNLI